MAKVSLATIAARAGVSKNTVSLALRRSPRISSATRKRVQRIADALGYARNPVVAHLMTELRKEQPAGYQRTLAMLNGHPDRLAFTRNPTVPAWVEGARRRAAQQGYRFDEFWMHDPELNGERFNRILAARGIRGVIVVGAFQQNRLPERFAATWQTHACVVAGVRTHEPTLSFCCVDHHEIVLEAMRQVRALGYRRPALVVDERVDTLVDGRFSSAMWLAQQDLPTRQRVPSFMHVTDEDTWRADFLAWNERHQPDVLLTLHPILGRWLQETGRAVPRDVGLVLLEKRPDRADWASMDQHNDVAGEAAVDLLVTMLHNSEFGAPAYARATFVSGTWFPGATVRVQK